MTTTWLLKDTLTAQGAAMAPNTPDDAAATSILHEMEALNKQRCPYCSGWGHSGNDCPTDMKLAGLRRYGTSAMKKVLRDARKHCRVVVAPTEVIQYSQLSPTLLKKRVKTNNGYDKMRGGGNKSQRRENEGGSGMNVSA